MFKPIMIENQQSLRCAHQHNLPIVQVVLDPQLKKEQRLLCSECLDNIEIDGKVIGYEKILQMMEEQQQLKVDQVENIIMIVMKQIELIESNIDQLKTNVILQLDQLKSIVHDWINNLQSLGLKYSKYSFHDELENMITNINKLKFNETSLMKDICGEHNNWDSKLTLKLEIFKKFSEYNKCMEILQNHQHMISKFCLNETNKAEQQIILLEDPIKLIQIYQSVKQQDYCASIAFNTSDSIMVSTSASIIQVWNFNKGRLQLLQSLKQHDDWINALVFSKKQYSFLSCSSDKTIRIWKLQTQNGWKSSCPYKQHTDTIYCMIINQNEDELFSGSVDRTIKVWKLDFNKNELIYLYSLDKHNNSIYALSLNQSERLLVSCANDKDQIIIWERGLHNKMEFKYFVIIDKNQIIKVFFNVLSNAVIILFIQLNNIYNNLLSIKSPGIQVLFIKENQFILVSSSKLINEMLVFELKDDIFQDNEEKKVHLNESNFEVNMYLFPIIYNKQRNLMIVRHKTNIYLIRELNNGKFKIVEQLHMLGNEIYGAVTNNWQHLVFWIKSKKEYSIYELQYT